MKLHDAEIDCPKHQGRIHVLQCIDKCLVKCPAFHVLTQSQIPGAGR
jgi:hypothetical protein